MLSWKVCRRYTESLISREPRNIKLYGNTAVNYCVGSTGGGGLWRRRDVDRECTGGGCEDDAGQGVASHGSRVKRREMKRLWTTA
jgi:hypothetical protein